MSNKLKPVHIDGALLVICGIVSAMLAYLTSEEAKQFLEPAHIFYLKAIGAGLDAGTAMLIAFRSNSLADSRNDTVGQPPARPDAKDLTAPPASATVQTENKPPA